MALLVAVLLVVNAPALVAGEAFPTEPLTNYAHFSASTDEQTTPTPYSPIENTETPQPTDLADETVSTEEPANQDPASQTENAENAEDAENAETPLPTDFAEEPAIPEEPTNEDASASQMEDAENAENAENAETPQPTDFAEEPIAPDEPVITEQPISEDAAASQTENAEDAEDTEDAENAENTETPLPVDPTEGASPTEAPGEQPTATPTDTEPTDSPLPPPEDEYSSPYAYVEQGIELYSDAMRSIRIGTVAEDSVMLVYEVKAFETGSLYEAYFDTEISKLNENCEHAYFYSQPVERPTQAQTAEYIAVMSSYHSVNGHNIFLANVLSQPTEAAETAEPSLEENPANGEAQPSESTEASVVQNDTVEETPLPEETPSNPEDESSDDNSGDYSDENSDVGSAENSGSSSDQSSEEIEATSSPVFFEDDEEVSFFSDDTEFFLEPDDEEVYLFIELPEQSEKPETETAEQDDAIPAAEETEEAFSTSDSASEPAEEFVPVLVQPKKEIRIAMDYDTETLQLGSTITLTAVLEGYEGMDYICTWQKAQADAHGAVVSDWQDTQQAETICYTLSPENLSTVWRVRVTVSQADQAIETDNSTEQEMENGSLDLTDAPEHFQPEE